MKISLNGISRIYNDAGRPLTVLKDVSYDFSSGKSTAVVGKSGVGKSTLLHLLAGLDTASEGNIQFDDITINKLSQDSLAAFRLNNIGFIFQFNNLLSEFTAIENVSLPAILAGSPESDAVSRARDILTDVGLKERFDHKPSELSGGEQQRVAVARALINNPKVILADEPTGSLDVETSNEIGNLLLRLSRDKNVTLVAVTHNREYAALFNHQVEMLPGGNLSAIKLA